MVMGYHSGGCGLRRAMVMGYLGGGCGLAPWQLFAATMGCDRGGAPMGCDASAVESFLKALSSNRHITVM
jgi:hypothetical protein